MSYKLLRIHNIEKSRAFAFVLALVLAVSLIPVIGAAAYDDTSVAYAEQPNQTGNWTDWQNYDTSWYISGTPYNISNAAQLAGLAALVNGTAQFTTGGPVQPPVDFADDTITLTGTASDYDLSAHYWTPIGGGGAVAAGVPNAPAFSGGFDGRYNGATGGGPQIANMTIDPNLLTLGNGGFGLFGFVNGGSIVNVSVSGGAISHPSPKATLVGGVVGYIYGNVANCHSSVTINLPGSSSSSASNIGGVVGAIESKTTSSPDDLYISYAENTGGIAGGTRVGGVVGSVYASNNGGVLVSASYNSGTVDQYVSGSKDYAGGIVGYCQGYLSQVANMGGVTERVSGHYIAGIAGLIQGYEIPYGSIKYSYSNGPVRGDANYSQALFATADSNANAIITDVFWGNGSVIDQATGSSWGTDTDVLKLTDAQFANTAPVTTSAVTDYLVNILNTPSTPTAVFAAGTDTPVIIYPAYANTHTISPAALAGDLDPADGSAVFLDGTAAAGGTGTRAAPYNNFADAAAAANRLSQSIYIRGPVTVSGTETWSLNTGLKLYRSSIFTGFPVTVANGGNLTLTNITVDGNWVNGGGNVSVSSKSLFGVSAGGTLTVGDGAVLTNNFADSGSAVRIDGGAATVNEGASITSNQAIANGGGVAVYSPTTPTAVNGAFTMNGGTVGGNKAQLGGGVYSQTNSVMTITGGTLSGNTATRNGNGIYVSGNTSASRPSELFLAPASTLTFGSSDNIYLPTGVVFGVRVTLTSNVYVTCEDPTTEDRLVAVIRDETIAFDSLDYFVYYNDSAHTFNVDDDYNIILES
ncbi:MAG: autotransporter adhesin family protein [Clostridiales Family XIII bacterium]|jgi:hypothetical protein|nr:autotransporter adhesin family protein [Clostridiales Family XIII bacterium]